jgi:hypothetical protein
LKNLNKEFEFDKKSLKELEKELSKLNNKSCNHVDFLKYISKKIEYNKKVNNQYNTEYVKKIKWFGYLNKMKHENNLLNHIENVFSY